MTTIVQARRFLLCARRHLRYAEYSRENFKLIRLQWTPEKVECDWLMRRNDPWDKDVSPRVAREHQTFQALRDAIELRNVVFKSFPSAQTAELQMFDLDATGKLELVMSGSVDRGNEVYYRIPSVAMRARLCGFQFTLADGVLERRTRSGQSAA